MVRRKARRRARDDARRQITRYGVIVAVVCLVAGAGLFGIIKLWQAVTGMEAFRVNPADVPVNSEWVNPEAIRADFLRTDPTGILKERCSLFASDLAQHVADAYANSPWVRRVEYVQRIFPNRLDVKLDLRMPFVLVRNAGAWYCLDEDGVVLSPDIYRLTRDGYPRLRPFVVLMNNPPAPAPGEVWDDAAAYGGLELAKHCREHLAEDVRVNWIEVFPEGPPGYQFATATLVLDTGVRVRWGRTPGFRPSPAEPPILHKTTALIAWVKSEEANLASHESLDVTHDLPIVKTLQIRE